MQFTFASSSLKHLLYLLLVTSTAFLAYQYSPTPQHAWIVWSALLLSLLTLGATPQKRIQLQILTGLLIAFTASLGGFATVCFILKIVFLFLITLTATYLGQQYAHYIYPLFLINLLTLLSTSTPITLQDNLQRSFFILAGTLIAAFFQLLFLPFFQRSEWKAWHLLSIRNLKLLNEELFSCFLQPDYPECVYLYERRIHLSKNRFIRSLMRLQQTADLSSNQTQRSEHAIVKLNHLYELTLDYAQLRRRVSDHTIFRLCETELTAILAEIKGAFDQMLQSIQKPATLTIDTYPLEEKIKRFEENYQHVLQVTAREPLAFLLFVTSLRLLSKEMTS